MKIVENDEMIDKIKKRFKTKKRPKDANQDEFLVQDPSASITIEEYMPQEWFRVVEGDEDEEEVVYSSNG